MLCNINYFQLRKQGKHTLEAKSAKIGDSIQQKTTILNSGPQSPEGAPFQLWKQSALQLLSQGKSWPLLLCWISWKENPQLAHENYPWSICLGMLTYADLGLSPVELGGTCFQVKTFLGLSCHTAAQPYEKSEKYLLSKRNRIYAAVSHLFQWDLFQSKYRCKYSFLCKRPMN